MKTQTNDQGRIPWLAPALFSTLLLSLGVVLLRSDEQAPPKIGLQTADMQWIEGIQQSYAISLASTVHMGVASGGSPVSINQVIEGTMHLRVFEVDANRVELGFQLDPVKLSVNGQPDTARQGALSIAFGATFEDTGRPLEFRFPPGLDPEARVQLEEVVRSFQVVLEPGAETWTVEEEHASGRYLAAYEHMGDGSLSKRKQDYVRGSDIRDGVQLLRNASNRILRSEGRLRLAAEGAWLDSAELEDEIIVSTGPEAMFRAVLRAELQALPDISTRSLVLATASDLPGLLDAQRAAVRDATAEAEVARIPVTAEDIARFRASLMAFNESGGENFDLLQALAAEVRRFPELAALIPDVLTDPALVDRAASGLIHVLELAGHGEAQEALGVVLEDRSRSHMNRIRAVIAMGGVTEPTQAAMERMWRIAVDRRGEPAADLANTALLAIGSLGNTLLETDSETYSDLRDRLLGSLNGTADVQAAAIALKAIGNTRDESFVADVSLRLSAPSSLVRAAAASALGTMDSEQALEILTASLSPESDARVRGAITLGLSQQSRTSNATFDTVRALIADEQDEDARYEMARYLADHLESYPQGRAALQDLLKRETEARTVRYVTGKLLR